MSAQKPLPQPVRRLIGPSLRLTRAGMVAERITVCFWPLWTLAFAIIAAFAFGFQDWAPVELFWAASLGVPVALIWALVAGLRRFRWPAEAEAAARLDRTLPGQPLSALGDDMAVGVNDAGAAAVWRAHLTRMAARLSGAKAVPPDLRIARRDPFALRYLAATAFVMAVLFGSLWRVTEIGRPGAAHPAAAGETASWEGWIEPPRYTGRPAVYLNAQKDAALSLPQGSRVTVRLYGPDGALALRQTVGDAAVADKATTAAAPPQPATGPRSYSFTLDRSGTLAIDGSGGREWEVTVVADAPPSITLGGPMKRMAKGTMSQPFVATDDVGIVKGEARFELDLSAVDRRYGLAAAPDPVPPLAFDLPMPVNGSRKNVKEVLAEDASEHPWANLPVKMTLSVTDGAGHTATTAPTSVVLPGRRFFDPLAAAVIEMRRDLLWAGSANAARVVQILKAVTWKPEGFIRNEKAYLLLRVAIRRLEGAAQDGALPTAVRDETAKALWDVALLIEDGGLDDALARMQRAQERLSEAIRNGASDDEIKKLMDDLRGATDDYMRMLAEKGQEDPADKFAKNQPTQTITQDQIQQMMDEIQKLMEQGKKAEAQAMLDQLNQLLQNLKVTQGQGGDGQGGKGGEAMKNLRQTLRDQQDLSDDTFRQQQRGGRGQQGSTSQGGQQGEQPGDQQGDKKGDQQGGSNGIERGPDGQTGGGKSLAERQKELRDELNRQQGALPDAQGQDADRARRSFADAGRAMDQAEQALRDGDMRGAIDRQADAIEKLRDGMRGMNQALAQDQNRMTGENGQSEADASGEMPRDPLGRTEGQYGQTGSDKSMLQGRDVYGRARDLLDEIRRRSSDQNRPADERDYLKRLMGSF